MKQQQLTGYKPTYPRKALRGAALTTAALVAMGGLGGCRQAAKLEELRTEGIVPVETPYEGELVLDGEVAIAEPTEEPMLQGKIAVPEPTEEELVLDGEEMIEEPEKTPEVPLRTTGVLLMPTPTPEA